MKNLILALGIVSSLGSLVIIGAVAGCSGHHQQKSTTSTRETIQSAPADPVTIEKRTTTKTETHSEN